MAGESFDVGGVRLARPFRIRRLGHFGVNVMDMEAARRFYEGLLGFRISDQLDFSSRFSEEQRARLGSCVGYFSRHGTEHHSFVFFPRRALDALHDAARERADITINQITWQAGSLGEVVDGFEWFKSRGAKINRAGRDMPGSNWHYGAGRLGRTAASGRAAPKGGQFRAAGNGSGVSGHVCGRSFPRSVELTRQ